MQARLSLIVLLTLLAGLIAASPHRLLYDERYYMEASYLLTATGSFDTLMHTRLDVVAGPLYPYLHWLAAPLTALQPPWIRFINLGSLLVALAAIAATLHRLGYRNVAARTAMLLAVPMIWPTSGLALTELPALAFACLAVALATHGATAPIASARFGLFALSGLCAGLAVLGRQTYLPALGGFVLIGLVEPRLRLPALAALVLAGLGIAPMILAWGGLIPPWQTSVDSGIVPVHGVLAVVYLATAIALIAPGFFLVLRERGGWLALVGTALGGIAVIVATGFRIEVATRVVDKLPLSVQPLAQLAATLAMVTLAAMLLVAALCHLYERRSDMNFLLLATLTIVLTGTAAGVTHQFSSRYVLAAFPFALLAVQPWFQPGRWATVRLLGGAALGIASLSAYYWNQPPEPPGRLLPDSVAPRELIDRLPLREPA